MGAFKPAKGDIEVDVHGENEAGEEFRFVRATLANGRTSKELKLTVGRE